MQVGWHAHHPHHTDPMTPLWTRARSRQRRTSPSPCPHPDTLQLVEEREGDGSALDASGSGAVAERDGATLRLKEGGGVFYAPGPLQSVAVHWPRLVAGAPLASTCLERLRREAAPIHFFDRAVVACPSRA